VADFHAAERHTHITQLLRQGASLPEATELARHTDVKMTMRYAHLGLDDQARALAALSVPTTPSAAEPASLACPPHSEVVSRGDRANGSNGQNESSRVTARPRSAAGQKRQNPRRGKGFGNESQTESSAVADDPKWRRRQSNTTDEGSIAIDHNDLQRVKQAVVAPGHRASDMMGLFLAVNGIDADRGALQFVIDAWPSLSTEDRMAICSIVRANVVR